MQAPLSPNDSVHRLKRYGLNSTPNAMDSAVPRWRGRAGTASLPDQGQVQRYIHGGWKTYSPEHRRIQKALKDLLAKDFPNAFIEFEKNYIDVVARTKDELLLFEVKSDLSPLSVIRQALGQVIEYAFHPCRQHDLPVRLVIVGRSELEGDDRIYFDGIKKRFDFPIEYWSVSV